MLASIQLHLGHAKPSVLAVQDFRVLGVATVCDETHPSAQNFVVLRLAACCPKLPDKVFVIPKLPPLLQSLFSPAVRITWYTDQIICPTPPDMDLPFPVDLLRASSVYTYAYMNIYIYIDR